MLIPLETTKGYEFFRNNRRVRSITTLVMGDLIVHEFGIQRAVKPRICAVEASSSRITTNQLRTAKLVVRHSGLMLLVSVRGSMTLWNIQA
jgi:hypothetical protein